MARFRLVLPALLLGVALALAASAAFISLPVGTQKAPQSLRQQPPTTGVTSSNSLPLVAAPISEAAEEARESALRWIGAGVAVGLLTALCSAPAEAYDARARITPENWTIKAAKHLELCKDSKKFKKKIKDQLFKVTARQKKFPKGSVVFNRYEERIMKVKRRETAYGERFCGKKDGLPRVIATGENVRGGVVIPSLMFLYTAGWIGWAGRTYLQRTQDRMKELNIDVPLALTCMASGFSWPVQAWQAIVNGSMAKKDTEFYRSGLACN